MEGVGHEGRGVDSARIAVTSIVSALVELDVSKNVLWGSFWGLRRLFAREPVETLGLVRVGLRVRVVYEVARDENSVEQG